MNIKRTWKTKVTLGLLASALILHAIPRMYVGFKNESLNRRSPTLTSEDARDLFEKERRLLGLENVNIKLDLANLDPNLAASGRTIRHSKNDYGIIIYQPYKFQVIAHELFHVREFIDGKINFQSKNLNLFDYGCETRAVNYAEIRLNQYCQENKCP